MYGLLIQCRTIPYDFKSGSNQLVDKITKSMNIESIRKCMMSFVQEM